MDIMELRVQLYKLMSETSGPFNPKLLRQRYEALQSTCPNQDLPAYLLENYSFGTAKKLSSFLDCIYGKERRHTVCDARVKKTPAQRNKVIPRTVLTAQQWVLSKTGVRLDEEQAIAVDSRGRDFLVTARAGSGKTTVLVSRALYLMGYHKVSPSQILLLAFNRDAADEIQERVKRFSPSAIPHIMTFHALAYRMVHPEQNLLYDGPDGRDPLLSRYVQEIFNDLYKNPEYRDKVREMMRYCFSEDPDHILEYLARNKKIDKKLFIDYLRSMPSETLKGDYVKSLGEKLIANFLFEHNIKYGYERNHWWHGTNYRPDFTVPLPGRTESGVVIEYFGLVGRKDYDQTSDCKRKYWEQNENWNLIEMSRHDLAGGNRKAFLEKLKEQLCKEGFPCNRLSKDEVWSRVEERIITRTATACGSFISRCRKETIGPKELESRMLSHDFINHQEKLFLSLARDLYKRYIFRLNSTGDEDFDGLMLRSIRLAESGHTDFKSKNMIGSVDKLKYILIDEFQDFNYLFWKLIQVFRKTNPAIELFCVGDDWQAINAFAGSDLRYFNNFEKHLGPKADRKISTNYRSGSKIVEAGNALMGRLGDKARANRSESGKVFLADLEDLTLSGEEIHRHKGDQITPAILRLLISNLRTASNVTMLCRKNQLPFYISCGRRYKKDIYGYLQYIRSFFNRNLHEKINISTVHKYKGRESDVVILVDAIRRSYPLIHPDWIFSRVLGESPEKIVDEERRLFYVALTRAIGRLYIIVDGDQQSPFLNEMQPRFAPTKLDWGHLVPWSQMTVSISNLYAGDRHQLPTVQIKELLQADGFHWDQNRQAWTKPLGAKAVNLQQLQERHWAKRADNILVTLSDLRAPDQPPQQFSIIDGHWQRCR